MAARTGNQPMDALRSHARLMAAAERASERYGWPLHVIDRARDDPAAEQPDAFIRALRSALHPGTTATDGEDAT